MVFPFSGSGDSMADASCVTTVIPGHTAVESLCGPEADDGVDDCGGVHRGEAVDDGDDESILLTVITGGEQDKALSCSGFRSH